MNHHHKHKELSSIRSDVFHEMFGEPSITKDDDNVRQIRERIEKEGKSVSLLLELVKALCLQFRYRDSLIILDEVLAMEPDDYQALRIKAIRLLTTGQLDESLVLFEKLDKISPDRLDTGYRIALCHFYKKEYLKSKECFKKLFLLCDGNPDMYIGVLYWYLLSKMNLGEDIQKEKYRYKVSDYHHHFGYDAAVRMFFDDSKDFEEETKKDNLTRIMYLTGLYYFALFKKEDKKASDLYGQCLACREYWSSFSGLAIWYHELDLRKKK